MRWWVRLSKRRGQSPVERVDDSTFGRLVWSRDDESWIGEYGGYPILIGYTGSAEPNSTLLAYARDLLGQDGSAFAPILVAARIAHAENFRRWAAEFAGLSVGELWFWKSDRGMGCFVELIGGEPERSWRVEFEGQSCSGFGFDT